MNLKTQLEHESNKAATIYSVDDDRKIAFKAGAQWLADYLGRVMSHGIYENVSGYPKKYIEGLMTSDFRSVMKQLLKIQPDEVSPPLPQIEVKDE